MIAKSQDILTLPGSIFTCPNNIFKKKYILFLFFAGTEQIRFNTTDLGPLVNDSVITVAYPDGHWSLPYFDCGGGDIWMMTYTVPFFGYKDGKFKFKYDHFFSFQSHFFFINVVLKAQFRTQIVNHIIILIY